VQLTRPDLRSLGSLGLVTAALVVASPASAFLRADEQNAGFIFQYFADADDIHVYSNHANYTLDLTGPWSWNSKFNHEMVVVPALTAPAGSQESVDAITTASRPIRDNNDAYRDFAKHRNEFQTALTRDNVMAGYYVSSENDYFAQQVKANADWDFLDQNLNLSTGASFGWDSITPLEDADAATSIQDFRHTTHFNVVATQVLSRTTVARVGLEMNVVNGLQHNPYRNVYVDGGNVAERHPDQRLRRDAFLKVNQYFGNRSSLKLDYKIYGDDWGIFSHTVGTRLAQYVTPDFVVRYRYRFYTQSAADFFRDEYLVAGGIDGYQTGDYRMGEFAAHLFGTRVDWGLASLFGHDRMWGRLKLSLGYERYFNSNNFSANIFESGLSLAF